MFQGSDIGGMFFYFSQVREGLWKERYKRTACTSIMCKSLLWSILEIELFGVEDPEINVHKS